VPAGTPPAQVADEDAARDGLPRTGSTTMTIVLLCVALGLLNLGYLSWSATRPGPRPIT
jgi:hypothetical protein